MRYHGVPSRPDREPRRAETGLTRRGPRRRSLAALLLLPGIIAGLLWLSPQKGFSIINVLTPPSTPVATKTLTQANIPVSTANLSSIKTVFVIVMESYPWSAVKDYPYMKAMQAQGSYATQYFRPSKMGNNLLSEPEYIWLEAGSNLGVRTDDDPSANSVSTTSHLVTLLKNAGISWKAYEEGISGTDCPLTDTGNYAVRHDPFVFFQDVTNNNSSSSAYCISHVRPYTELSNDLANNTVASYNFITPDVCDDMHDNCTGDPIAQGDNWLSVEVPKIMNSQAYKNGGAIFITWDNSNISGTDPIGMIALSPYAKVGYSNSIHYDHSSLLKTVEEILGVSPLLRNASTATDLSDLFRAAPRPNQTPSPAQTPNPTASASPSGEPMPVGDIPGWHQVFTDDFLSDVPLGSFPQYGNPGTSAEAGKWISYPDGWTDTSGNGTYYPSKVISVQNGIMNLYLHTENGTHMVSAPEPVIPGAIGTNPGGLLYGRYVIRFRADSLHGYKTAWLLWPESELWPQDGEIDFPEGHLDGTISAFMHWQGGTSGSSQDAYLTTTTYTSWHTAVIEWTPTSVKFILDGQSIGNSTTASKIPNTPMRWVIQTETNTHGTVPGNAVAGNVQIDWVAVYVPTQ